VGPVVRPVAVTAVLSASATTTARQESVLVTVSASGVVPSGPVTVFAGGRVLAGKLAAGQVRVPLGRLAAGSHQVVAFYGGDSATAAQSANAGALAVSKAAPKVAAKRVKGKAKVTVTVSHAQVPAPTGKVTVKVVRKGKVVASKTYNLAASKKGKATVKIPKVKAGKYQVKVSYAGNAVLGAKTAKTIKKYTVK
jgi:hypothetical protein